ncbi:MAG: peptidase MA family metallohydrolase [Nitrospiraceae bacterium]|nr:peptidase MA family metallohydrolase [Nitrospiraceae bacterium]
MTKRIAFLSAILLFWVQAARPASAGVSSINGEGVSVRFDAPLLNAAKDILKVYPAVRDELAMDLGMGTDLRPEIVLIKDRASFRKEAGSDLVTAYAIPGKDLIVIDYSKMGGHPYTVEVTLKHELCHLELHHQIGQNGDGRMPRWFDEGICQWVTGGFGELIDGGDRSVLTSAVLSGRLLSIGRMTASFPSDGREMLLAYAESRSIVEYIEKTFGARAVRAVLDRMRGGDDLDAAISNSLHISSVELEKRWKASLSTKNAWLYYLRDNLYEILFMLGALFTVCGFFRALKRRREYKDDEEGGEKDEDGDGEETPPPP